MYFLLVISILFVLISNKLGSERQSTFLGELMDPIREIWLSDKMQR